jgi:hypothetical protein
MKNALIDPTTSVQFIAAWTSSTPYKPIIETYANSARVCEVSDASFDVAPPLFWVECSDNVVADQWYYDTVTAQLNPVVNAPFPELAPSEPTQTGAEQF